MWTVLLSCNDGNRFIIIISPDFLCNSHPPVRFSLSYDSNQTHPSFETLHLFELLTAAHAVSQGSKSALFGIHVIAVIDKTERGPWPMTPIRGCLEYCYLRIWTHDLLMIKRMCFCCTTGKHVCIRKMAGTWAACGSPLHTPDTCTQPCAAGSCNTGRPEK